MLQRITAILVLVILLLNVASRYPAFKFEQWRIRKAISTRIEHLFNYNELQLVTLPKNSVDIEWVRPGKEFRYKGQLYDVVRCENNPTSVSYYCISDDDETQLEAHYNQFMNAQDSSDGSAATGVSISILKIFFSLVYIPQQETATHFQQYFTTQYSSIYSCLYTSAFTSITGPPPKLFI